MSYCAALMLPALTIATAGMLAAQGGTTPKAAATDYPAHTKVGDLSIGAEYLVHSFSSGNQMFIAKNYLVVEVALFPATGLTLPVSATHFTLRVNRRKQPIAPQPAEVVAGDLRYPDPQTDSGIHPVAQVGPIVLGQPAPVERFPGDPNARNTQPAPRNPSDDPNLAKDPPLSAGDLAVQAALPEGDRHGPTSGFLYFPYRGKIGHIRSLELVFSGPPGNTTLALPLD